MSIAELTKHAASSFLRITTNDFCRRDWLLSLMLKNAQYNLSGAELAVWENSVLCHYPWTWQSTSFYDKSLLFNKPDMDKFARRLRGRAIMVLKSIRDLTWKNLAELRQPSGTTNPDQESLYRTILDAAGQPDLCIAPKWFFKRFGAQFDEGKLRNIQYQGVDLRYINGWPKNLLLLGQASQIHWYAMTSTLLDTQQDYDITRMANAFQISAFGRWNFGNPDKWTAVEVKP